MSALISSTICTASGANGATTPAINTTGAKFLALCVAYSSNGSGLTISDSKGNVWTALTTRTSIPAGISTRIFYCLNPIVGAGHTFSALGTNVFSVISAFAFDTSVTFDQQNGAATTTSVSIQAGSITPPRNGAILIASVNTNTGTTIAINGSYSKLSKDFSSGTNFGGGGAYLIQSVAAATNPTWSWASGTTGETAAIASFLPVLFTPTSVSGSVALTSGRTIANTPPQIFQSQLESPYGIF